jgi:CBS domain-containing protein
MARFVDEVMNRELFSVRPTQRADQLLGFLLALGINGAPVVDVEGMPLGMVSMRELSPERDGSTASDRMTKPAVTVSGRALIEDAGRLLAERGLHEAVVVDDDGRAIGMISAVDVLCGLLGLPARHPGAFPHYDRVTGTAWTDDTPLEAARLQVAPDGPGVVVLIHGSPPGAPDAVVYAEACADVRARLIELVDRPPSTPALARALRSGGVRFRAASVRDPAKRGRVLEAVVGQAVASLWHPAPGSA